VPSRARPIPIRFWLGFAVAAAAALLYVPTLGHAFLNYDDDLYLTRNPHLRLGLSPAGLAWAFTTGYGANWFPLTWLSWLIDHAIWGLDPRGFHLTNLLLHAASTALLFGVLARMTGAVGRSAFVAAIFALHPVHVESVAWAAERKDVLSGLFWMLTLWAYARYVERPSWRRYLPVPLFLALGLMAKPMLVTLPFVLLLLDYWPLRRIPPLRRAILEKLPLLALSAISSVVTYQVQHAAGAVQPVQVYPASVRALNALLAYATYLRQAFWPSGLAVFYPHPGEDVSRAAAGGAALLLAAITAVALRRRARQPYLAVGWFWFVGTLVPVIGLVQLGAQAHADRYLYVPLIGLSMTVSWAVPDLLARRWPRAPLMLGAAALAALAFTSVRQVARWRDSATLFAHTLDVTRENAVAHLNLGVALADKGDHAEARRHLEEAIRIHPGSAEAHGALAEVLARQGQREEALARFRTALRLDPGLSRVHNGFGRALLEGGDVEEAALHFREAVRLDAAYAEAHSNLGVALLRAGSFAEAVEHLREATTLDPASAEAHNNWGVALMNRGDLDEAVKHFERATALGSADADGNWALALVRKGDFNGAAERYRRALATRPDDPEMHQALGMALSEGGRFEEAVEPYRRALALDPTSAEAHNALGIALGSLGRLTEATDHFRRAVELRPDYPQAHNNWGLALVQEGRIADAVARFRAAVELDPGYADAHNNLGVFLARQGRVAEAVEHFQQALRLDAAHADARVNLGKILGAKGRTQFKDLKP
jgi:Flp pilus assembly protein TadD